MAAIARDPGEGKVSKLYIKKYNGGEEKRFAPQLISFSIFEDLQKPSIYAEFVLKDLGNLLQSWNAEGRGGNATEGDESIFVSVSDYTESPVTRDYEFGIISVTNGTSNPTETGLVYVIRAVSMEHLKNTQKLVTKAYKDKIENIVQDIAKSYLGTSKQFKKIDPTKDTVEIAIPTFNSFTSIDMLRKRAVSEKYPNSPYVFYESSEGYNFVTIDYLVEQGRGGGKEYTFFSAEERKHGDPSSYRNIIDYQIVKNFNTYEKIRQGAMAVNVLSFDVTTKKYDRKKYDIKSAKKPLTTDSKGVLYRDNLYQQFPDAGTFVFLPTSADIKTTMAENAGFKEISSAFFGDTSIVFIVAGDTSVMVGDMVTLKVPNLDTAAKEDEKNFDFTNDQKYQGNYLVTKLRHMFSLNEHQMVVEATKIGKFS